MKSFRLTIAITTALAILAPSAVAVPAQAAVSEAEALITAIHRASALGLKSTALQVSSSGAVPFGRSRAVFNSSSGGGALNSLTATSFPFVVTSGSTFEPNIPSPPGRRLPQVKYIGLIVDAGTNLVDNEYFGPTPPPIEELGAVVTINLTSSQATAASRSCRVDQLLVAALARKQLGARHRSAERSLSTCKARHRG